MVAHLIGGVMQWLASKVTNEAPGMTFADHMDPYSCRIRRSLGGTAISTRSP